MAIYIGNEADNVFVGTIGDDLARGNDGNDSLSGNAGNDRLEGGAGSDFLDGGNGVNSLASYLASPGFFDFPSLIPWTSLDIFAEQDTLIGGLGSDRFAAGYGDNVAGGAGTNYLAINFLGGTAGVIADFAQQLNGGSITIGGGVISGISAIVNIQGSNFDDYIVSVRTALSRPTDRNPNSILYGNGGNDHIIADTSTGYVSGGEGNDVIDARAVTYDPRIDLKAPETKIDGDAGDDLIFANATASNVNGGEGNDTIFAERIAFGGAGNDQITLDFANNASLGRFADGGAGDDVLTIVGGPGELVGGSGADTLRGAAGNDYLASGDLEYDPNFIAYGFTFSIGGIDVGLEHDVLFGGDGNDVLLIGYGDDADGGSGTDTLSLSLKAATTGIVLNTADIVSGNALALGGGVISSVESVALIYGSAFDDTIIAAPQADQISIAGGDGNDTVVRSSGWVSFDGGNGNDRMIFDRFDGPWAFQGGAGIDTIDVRNVSSSAQIDLDLSVGLNDVENVDGSDFGDIIKGNANANALNGYGGNDELWGSDGDTLSGGEGDDVLSAIGTGITMFGGNGDDFFIGSQGRDLIDGGDGVDHASYTSALAGVVVSLQLSGPQNTKGAGADTLVSIENLTGSQFDDQLIGSAGNNIIDGEEGDDILNGNGGNDWLFGGAGNDVLKSGAGDDRLIGGTGIDTADYSKATAFVSVNLGVTVSQPTLGAGNDIIIEIENVVGSNFGDTLSGNLGANEIDGGAGNDTLVGRNGDDILIGGLGADKLTGGQGADQLRGGTGADNFRFTVLSDSTVAAPGRDTIFDFSRAQLDKIGLVGIDANTNIAGDQAFTLVGGFTGSAGQLVSSFNASAGYYEVSGDVNGDGVADFAINVHSATALFSNDFIL